MTLTINTFKPKEKLYVRIFPSTLTPNSFVMNNLNRVAKVCALPDDNSDGDEGTLGAGMVFIEFEDEIKVINSKDVEFITQKEYFEGKLKHG